MTKKISIKQFIQAIQKLPPDEPGNYPGKLFKTQKEHWLGWLNGYHTPGAYGRQVDKTRDARYAYNHIVEHEMLLWIISAAGVDEKLVNRARKSIKNLVLRQQKSAAIRKIIPWDVLAGAIWR